MKLGFLPMEQYLHLLIDILYHGTGTIVQLFKNPCTRIQGSSNSVRDMLRKLFEYLTGQTVGTNANDPDVAAAMQKVIDDSKMSDGTRICYPKSGEKVVFMVKRFEEDGFTSYWV